MSRSEITTAFSSAILLTLMALPAGCHELPHPMDPLVLPPAAEIEMIHVTRLQSNGDRDAEWQIDNRQKIEAILAELGSNNTGYSSAMDGLTPQEYAIALDGKDRMEAMVWVGPDWLGGVDARHKDEKGGLASHYRKLDAQQHARLVALLQQPPAE
jgi:hypothetical protein